VDCRRARAAGREGDRDRGEARVATKASARHENNCGAERSIEWGMLR